MFARTGSSAVRTSTTDFGRRVTLRIVLLIFNRRTASGRRSSCVNTITWRVRAVSSSARASPSTRAGSIDCTGSSMTTKRNGLSGRVARGQEQAQRQRVQFALAHDAERRAGTPSTVTSSVTRRWLLVPVKFDPSKLDVALLTQMLPCGHRLIGNRREALVADFGGGVLQPVLGVLDPRNVFGAGPGIARRCRSTQRAPSRSAASDPRGVAAPRPPLS